MDFKPSRIEIVVSGSKYSIDSSILTDKPFTKLGKLATKSPKASESEKETTFVFDRPISSFESVLEYYQTGELHMPHNTCPKSFQKELAFWEIDAGELEKCCLYRYITYMDDFETLYNFQSSLQKEQDQKDDRLKANTTSCRHLSARLWAILDNKESTVWAKTYLIIAVVFVLLSILTLALSTLPVFDQKLNSCELLEYMESFKGQDEEAITFLRNQNCESDPHEALQSYNDDHYDGDNDEDEDFDEGNDLNNRTESPNSSKESTTSAKRKTTLKITLPKSIKKRNDKFVTFEYTIILFFSVELVLRLIFCPSFRKYFTSILNIIEIVILIASYISIILEKTYTKMKYTEKGLQILQFFQIFRILRLLRIMQNVAAMRVLTYSVRSGYKDLFLVIFYLFSGIVMFGNFLYFLESTDNVPSIPDAWWWGVITMTTVGYGDTVPKSVGGKLIASLCAVSGVLLLSLMIPIFVNTFMSLYKFAHLHEKHETSKIKQLRDKDKVHTMDNSMSARDKLYNLKSI